MRILVTGGAGFIGSALCRFLVGENDICVLNVDKLNSSANLWSLDSIAENPNYRFLKADICDRATMDRALAEFRPDAIIHLAAESHVDRSVTEAGTFIQTNVVGTFTLLEAARGYWSGLRSAAKDAFRFLHVSTDAVYGSLGRDGRSTEETAYDPCSPYAASKAACDHLVIAWYRTYGFPALISNSCNSYGPYQSREKLIPSMILNAMDGLPLPIYGDGSHIRDWLYVDDHVRALMTILEKGRLGQRYNVGARNERSNLDVVIRICEILNTRHPDKPPHGLLITFVDDRPGHDQRHATDATRLEAELGWRAQETFEIGIDKTVDWYLANRHVWEPLRRNVDTGDPLRSLQDQKARKAS